MKRELRVLLDDAVHAHVAIKSLSDNIKSTLEDFPSYKDISLYESTIKIVDGVKFIVHPYITIGSFFETLTGQLARQAEDFSKIINLLNEESCEHDLK